MLAFCEFSFGPDINLLFVSFHSDQIFSCGPDNIIVILLYYYYNLVQILQVILFYRNVPVILCLRQLLLNLKGFDES